MDRRVCNIVRSQMPRQKHNKTIQASQKRNHLLTSTPFERSLMGWDEKTRKKNSSADFAYMVAIWSPEADAESLRMILDYNNWLFLFDDGVFRS